MRRRASAGGFGLIGAAGLAIVLSGCGSPASAPATSSPPETTSTSPSVTASASATASPGTASPTTASPTTTAAPAGWKSYTTSDGTLTFDYPDTWSVKESDGGAALVSDYGKTMARLRTGVGPGPACTAKSQFMVYDSAPIPALAREGVTPRFSYEARVNATSADPGKPNTFAYGITTAPEPTGTDACPISHVFPWPPRSASFGGVYDPFDTTPGKPMHVDTPEVYKDTEEYKIIKRAMMSLRPAGK
ncbi:hypothetical protein ACTWLI_02425 [Arthrobacter sp. Hor0625]|uniref:hypothetical protein n=1 Tax=Arthrobacter sp. Hor0625 TaxID=3457358 RepID=UPI00403E9114